MVQAFVNLDRLRHPGGDDHILRAPTLTILNCDNGVDETGKFSRGSLSFTPPSATTARSIPRVHNRSCLHENSTPRAPRGPVRFADDQSYILPLVHAVASITTNQTPVNSTRAVHTYADKMVDADELVKPSVCTNVQQARDYLTHAQPTRTHAIWTTLVAWNRENAHMLTGPQPDFLTWWDRFSAQADVHNLPASVSWRIANRLLPEHIQASVIQSCQDVNFQGYNRASLVQFVTRETGGKDCVLIAYDQLRALKPVGTDSLAHHLRCKT